MAEEKAELSKFDFEAWYHDEAQRLVGTIEKARESGDARAYSLFVDTLRHIDERIEMIGHRQREAKLA